MPDDRLAAAAQELYGAVPDAFTERRAELAARARDAGDRAAAKAIGSLRRPTRAAWVVNQLARAAPGAPGRLAELAGALRAAQEAGHGPRLRELSAARGALVDVLTAQALAAAGLSDPPASLRLEVSETLAAALADPEVAAAFAAGRLTRAARWSGFGVPPTAGGAAGKAAPRGREAEPPPEAVRAETVRAETVRAERAARERVQREEAERALGAATAAATAAGSAEERLEAEVRDLEQRLARARAGLAAARMRARHAEAAEQRARQALGHLPGF